MPSHARPPADGPACALPARPLQPGDTAKYGDVFAAMLRSSPQLQLALQRVATIAQIRWGGAPAAGLRDGGLQRRPWSHQLLPCRTCVSSGLLPLCCLRVRLHPGMVVCDGHAFLPL